jgi:hypothetical protein
MYDGTIGVCSGVAGITAARELGQYIKGFDKTQKYTGWIPGHRSDT